MATPGSAERPSQMDIRLSRQLWQASRFCLLSFAQRLRHPEPLTRTNCLEAFFGSATLLFSLNAPTFPMVNPLGQPCPHGERGLQCWQVRVNRHVLISRLRYLSRPHSPKR